MPLASDAFNGSGALGVTEQGGLAFVTNGSWARSGGLAATTTVDGSNPYAIVRLGTGDADCSITCSSGGGDALYFRVQDPSNWWRLRVRVIATTTSRVTGYTFGSWVLQGRQTVQYGDDSYALGDHYYGFDGTASSSTSWGHTDTVLTTKDSAGYYYHSQLYYTRTANPQYSYSTTYSNVVVLEKCIAGAITQVSSWSGTSTSLRVKTAGSSISYYSNGGLLETITDGALQTADGFGLGRGAPSSLTSSALDNLTVDLVGARFNGWGPLPL